MADMGGAEPVEAHEEEAVAEEAVAEGEAATSMVRQVRKAPSRHDGIKRPTKVLARITIDETQEHERSLGEASRAKKSITTANQSKNRERLTARGLSPNAFCEALFRIGSDVPWSASCRSSSSSV